MLNRLNHICRFVGEFTSTRFSIIDRWFALLRFLVIAGGLTWLFCTPESPYRLYLLYDFIFFCSYTVAIYLLIFRYPHKLSTLYLAALFLDLFFLYWLVRFTGGFTSEYFIALFLLIALHSFYFGMKVGLLVVALSSVVYLLAGEFDFDTISAVTLTFRLGFFFFIAVSMGLLSGKAKNDHARIEQLNEELQERKVELEQERDKLENILVGIGAGLVLVNSEQRVEWMNKVAESWFGPLQQHINKSCALSIWRTGDKCTDCPTMNCFRTSSIRHADVEYNDNRQSRRFFRVTSAPIYNKEAEIESVLELIQDITDEKAMQSQLVQSGKLAAIGELASGIAHEINNPLSSIAVCVEDMSESFRPYDGQDIQNTENIMECIQTIRNDIARCKRITMGLLDFSHHNTTQFEPTDINQLLLNTALLTRHKAEKEHIQINFHLNQDIPLVVLHADEIAQVFLNLLINAIDFTPSRKSVDVITDTSGDNQVMIRIIDRGKGIPKENLDKIFSAFYTTKSAGQGTGLGLSICKRLVERHNGRIDVCSQPANGTSVSVILPVEPECCVMPEKPDDESGS